MQRTEEIIKDCTQADLRGLLRQQFQDMRDYAGLYEIITSPNFESNVLRMIISMILEKADEETKKNMRPMPAGTSDAGGTATTVLQWSCACASARFRAFLYRCKCTARM